MTQHQGRIRETYPAEGDAYRYRLDEQGGRFIFQLEGDPLEDLSSAVTLSIESTKTGEGICRDEAGRSHPFAWAWVGPELHLWLDGTLYMFRPAGSPSGPARRRGSAAADDSGDVLAPMPGAVLQVLVAEGDRVERNQTVMVMESMKMELLISAPRDGVVRRLSVQPGQQVERGMRLLELDPQPDDGDT